ncbi:slc38a2, partial [Symbiodinium pilosum]
VREKSNHINSVSLLRQYYNRLPVRRKYRRAIMKGTMVMCEKTGQVRIPPLAISGYDERRNPYRGRFEDLRSTRIWLKD